MPASASDRRGVNVLVANRDCPLASSYPRDVLTMHRDMSNRLTASGVPLRDLHPVTTNSHASSATDPFAVVG